MSSLYIGEGDAGSVALRILFESPCLKPLTSLRYPMDRVWVTARISIWQTNHAAVTAS